MSPRSTSSWALVFSTSSWSSSTSRPSSWSTLLASPCLRTSPCTRCSRPRRQMIPRHVLIHCCGSDRTQADNLQWLTYWVVYAFLSVLESTINAVYWFRKFPCASAYCQHLKLTWVHSILLHLQVHRDLVDGSSSDQVSDVEIILAVLAANINLSGAQVVFHSFIQPVFARYFTSPSASQNLRAQAHKVE